MRRDCRAEIAELCKGVHCVDLDESFPTSIYLQSLASIQPRTSPKKFGKTGKRTSKFPLPFPLSRHLKSEARGSLECLLQHVLRQGRLEEEDGDAQPADDEWKPHRIKCQILTKRKIGGLFLGTYVRSVKKRPRRRLVRPRPILSLASSCELSLSVTSRTGGSVRGERANLKGLVLGCFEAKFCK